MYGTDISVATIIHYVESLINVPYRYEKTFNGTTKFDEKIRKLSFTSHFRPFGMNLKYDWPKINSDLQAAKSLFPISKYCYILDGAKFKNYLILKMSLDPLYLLENESRLWVKPRLERLGRSFLQQDFE